MRRPADLAEWAQRRYDKGFGRWLACIPTADGTPDAHGGGWPASFPIHPPTEAAVVQDPSTATAWVGSWARFEQKAHADVSVEWVTRRWKGFGDQRLPAHVRIASASGLASVAGAAAHWQVLSDMAAILFAAWPDDQVRVAAALPGMARRLARMPVEDIPRLIALVDWFIAHPGSGMLARQVAVADVDTKWLERHSDPVRRLVAALRGDGDLGLRVEPRRFRVRVLDGAGLSDFTAPTAELSMLDYAPRCVLLVENRDSLVPLREWPGVVAVHSQGFAAPELAVVPWIAGCRQIVYWGDLDTHGLRILGLVRQVLPQTESILMDPRTLQRFEHLVVPEPSGYRGDVSFLTASERRSLIALRASGGRLEQERIPWDYVESTLGSIFALIPLRHERHGSGPASHEARAP